MDDVAEQQEIANEISEAISNPVGFGQDVDEVTSLPITLQLS
jgi:charged multivesicular body protein 4